MGRPHLIRCCLCMLHAFSLCAGAGPIVFSVDSFEGDTVIEGDTIRAAFGFRNASSGPAVIEEIRPDCGCIATGMEQRQFEPGEEGTLAVAFATTGCAGRADRSILVSSRSAADSADTAHAVTLRISAHVRQEIGFRPASLNALARRGSRRATALGSCVNAGPAPVTVLSVRSEREDLVGLLTRQLPVTLAPGQSCDFSAVLAAWPPDSAQTVTTRVTVRTQGTRYPLHSCIVRFFPE